MIALPRYYGECLYELIDDVGSYSGLKCTPVDIGELVIVNLLSDSWIDIDGIPMVDELYKVNNMIPDDENMRSIAVIRFYAITGFKPS